MLNQLPPAGYILNYMVLSQNQSEWGTVFSKN